jgi:hypothetical protein
MKKNPRKTLCSFFMGLVAFLLTGNAAFADVVNPGPVGPSGGLILILGLASVTLTAVAIAIIINIRRKNAK